MSDSNYHYVCCVYAKHAAIMSRLAILGSLLDTQDLPCTSWHIMSLELFCHSLKRQLKTPAPVEARQAVSYSSKVPGHSVTWRAPCMQTLQVFPCSTAQRQLIRTACTTSNAALQSSCTQQLAGRIFQHRPALTLERAVGDKFGLDTELWTQAPFVAGVVPDLPVVSSWKQLGAKLTGRCASCGVCTISPTSSKQHLTVGLSTRGFPVSCDQRCSWCFCSLQASGCTTGSKS